MKILQHEFKEYCDQFFSDPEQSQKVYEFYKSLKATQENYQDKMMKPRERKKKSLKYLVDNFGCETVLEGILELERQFQAGEQKSNTLIYFNRFIQKFAENRKGGTKQQALFTKPKLTVSIPTRKRRYTNEYPAEHDKCNWMYSCSECGGEYDIWTRECPKCKNAIKWRDLQ